MSEKLTMTVDIRAQLNQFNSAMNTAKEVLNKTFSGKGIKTYTDEMNKIGRIFDKISRTTAGPIDSKATFMQMQKEVMDATQRIEGLRDSISNLRNLTLTQRLSFLPDSFAQNLAKGKNAIEGYYDTIKKINGTKVSDESYQKITKSLEEAEKKLEKINKLQETLAINQRAAADATAKTEAANKEIEEARILKEQITSLKQKNELRAKYNDLVKNSGLDEETIKTLRNARSSNAVQTTLSKVFSQEDVALINKAHNDESKTKGQKIASKRADEKRAKRDASIAAESAKAQAKVPTSLSKEKLDEIVKAFGDYDDALQRFKRSGGVENELKKETTTVEELDDKIKNLTTEVKNYDTTLKQSDTAIANNLSALARTGTTAEALENQIADLTQKKEELDTKFDAENELKLQEAYKKLSETLKAYGIDISECGDVTQMSAKEFKNLFSNLYDNEVVMQEIDRITPELAGQIDILGDRAEEAATQIYKESDAFDKLSERSENIDRLTARVKQFTGFVGVINLARKAMRDALQTVKDLDKAMTDMAVVTKSTVSDYWEQLPEYTKRANKLGATIRDMYEADTLYYQQGLKTNQVMQVSNETMKMARIAGLGAAEATDRMTNALRGFNMAINEESAQKINDVYSKLAAITASNVDEISTAMTKTASIAHSAGMEFETTAAFLSQIIETTRESAETAGTALKTVIARFQELKKAPSEIGEVDGEIIDANKIEGALRTVGVALRDSEGQFRKLDDVFMELAGKWGSLDKNTQRYIATIAAGSRQQSRFIALMQDYSHTVELVDAAYTSAGTSQQQYEKTLESMETILKRLQNSWNTFTMGLFNSNLLKGAASTATELLNLLNKILDTLDITNLGLGKIAITMVGINKLGVGFKIFTHQLKQENGTIINSFGAVNTAIGKTFTNGWKRLTGMKVSLDEYSQAIDRVKKASIGLASAESKLQIGQNDTSKSARQIGALKGNVTKASNENVAAITALNNSKAKLIATSQLEGDSKERLIALLNSENVELKTNADFVNLCTIATNEEATAEYLNANSKGKVITAEQKEQILLKQKLPLQYASTQANILNTASQSKLLKILTLGTSKMILSAAAKKADAIAATDAAKANWILVGSFTAVVAIAAAVVATIALIVTMIKKIIANKVENRIKEAKERLDDLNESIKDCKDNLKELEDQQEQYKSLKEELDKNIQGTNEWKKKLLEVNDLVYDLIQKYPVLAAYVSRTSSGELTISNEGWTAVQNQQNKQLRDYQIGAYAAQEKIYDLEIEAVKKRLKKGAGHYEKDIIDTFGGKGYYTSEEDLINKIREYSETEEGAGWKTFIAEYDVGQAEATAAIEGLINPLNEIQDSIEENTLVLDSLRESLVAPGETPAEKAAGSILIEAEQKANKEQINETISEFFGWGKLGKDYEDNDYVKEIAEYIAKRDKVSIASILSGNDRTTLTNLYMALIGGDKDTISKKARMGIFGGDRETLIKEIVEVFEYIKTNESVSNRLAGMSDKQISAISSAKSVNNMSREDARILDALRQNNDDLGKELADILERTGREKYSDIFDERFNAIQNSFTDKIGSQLEGFANKGFSIDQIKQFGQILQTQYANTGSYFNYSDLLSKQGGKEMLESFLNFDVSSIEDLEKARDTLVNGWPHLTKEIDDMIASTRKLSDAIHKVDLETVIKNTKELASLLGDLTTEQHGNIYSEEEYNKLIESGVAKKEEFLVNADGMYVLKTPMEQLKDAINNNTEAILAEQKERLGEKFEFAESYRSFQNRKDNRPYYSVEDDLEGFLRSNSSLFKAIGIANINSYEDYDRLRNEESGKLFREAIEELKNTYTQSAYEQDLKKIGESLTVLESEKGTTAMSYAKYDRGEITDEALRTRLGTDEFSREVDILNQFGEKVEENKERYDEFMKDIANKRSIQSAEKNLKQYISDVKTFAEEYEELTDDSLKYAKTLEQGNAVGLRNIARDNYDWYATLLSGFSEGNEQAYELLVKTILEENGILGEAQEAMLTQADTEWTRFGKAQYKKMVELANMLQNVGLGYTEANGKGGFTFNMFKGIGNIANTGSGSDSKDEWEDPYNWLWNINKRINKEIFERERLERAYQKAVEDATKSEKDLYDVSKKELANLERQAILERDKGQKAMQEAKMMMQQRPEFGNYVSWDAATGQIQVDYNKIDSENWGSARGEAFEEFVSRLEELNDEVQDSQTTLEEIEDLTEDIKNRGRDQYIELQDRIKNALVEINQREIDTAQKINDSIKTAQESLLNKIQEEISETRQIRANQEKEQELEDKRQRLNYLRRDTTGANAVQIRQLEEELRKGEQSYTDSLTDQTIQNIQKANQKAEEQRTEQIEIMNNQLTRWQETGAIWDTVNTSINEGFENPDNFLNSQVGALLATAENKRALSELQQADWEKELENQAKLAELFNNGELYQQGEQTLGEVQKCADELRSVQESTAKIGNVDQKLAQLLEVYPKSYADKVSGSVGGIATNTSKMYELLADLAKELNPRLKEIERLQEEAARKYPSNYSMLGGNNIGGKEDYDAVILRQTKVTGNATGGLNTYTGLAWLDGTPTKPEYVLNADQTKAFFDLVNALTSNESAKGGIGGDNYFDIDINVDELASDYDVTQLASKIKEEILEDANYRNVNLVSFLR